MSIASFFRSNARVKRDTIRPEAMARGKVYRDMSDERIAQLSETVAQTTVEVIEDHRRAKERMGIPEHIGEARPDAIAEEELADRLLVIEPRPAEQMEGRRLTEAETMDAIEAACDSSGEA